MTLRAPFPALVAGGESVQDPPPEFPVSLARRMAEVYGVAPECVLPVRGAAHGLALCRTLSDAHIVESPGAFGRPALTDSAADALARKSGALVIDERYAETSSRAPLSTFAVARENVISIRSLEYLYGLAGAPVGAAIAAPATLALLRAALEPEALATPVIRLAETALDPSRLSAIEQRAATIRTERARIAAALRIAGVIVEEGDGPGVLIVIENEDAALAECRKWGAAARRLGTNAIGALIGEVSANERLLAALGAATGAPPRRSAEVVRDTAETRIVVAVDLDAPAHPDVATGVGYFDHMLAQVATHGGFSLSLRCVGDLEVDPHHTIEDCALAFGEALSKALGPRRGYARFGFVVPMDEAEAQVSIDVGGRAYAVFDGSFAATHIGDYPTEMTPHVFRSLSQSLGAAIHMSVKGENDHHKTEACFKAFGRALRQALARDEAGAPSTKGAIL
jgi:histidinol-phosphate aminotransferase/imidazoleglycerol-phosphate dehydratase/histidinol-phosphatase